MIDSEAFKVRDYEENSIVVEPYTIEEVLEQQKSQLEILDQITNYVLEMLNEADDIREYLKNNPFKMP